MTREEIEHSNLKQINLHPDFQLCGIKITQMTYNEDNKLFFLERGICRITSAHLLNAIRSAQYKKYLEKEIDLRKKP